VDTMTKWVGIVFAAGIALMVIEYRVAIRKKEGFTPTDKKRILGILWITGFFALLVAGLIWMSPD
jgi:hypothetical protein